MKNHIYITLINVVLCSCGGGDHIPEVNNPPSPPSLTAPTNNLLCVDNTISFQWNASTDPDGDAINYQLQIATDYQFTQNSQNKNTKDTSTSVNLDKGVTYYWRVRAKDISGATSNYSSIFSFHTSGEGISNHLPFSPTLLRPELNSSINESTATLQWAAGDVDANDTLTFDIYLDLVNPPTAKVAEDYSETSLIQNIESSKTYYWKVVVKDNNGGQSLGQVWQFKTD